MTTQHAHLGGSSATRWINCSASAILTRNIPNKAGRAADEGTAAHELAEWCLKSDRDPAERFGDVIEVNGEGFPVNEDMVIAVRDYVQLCRLVIWAADWHDIETRVDLHPLWDGDPPSEPLFGTTDFTGYVAENKRVYVIDFKYGAGVFVEVYDADQPRYYALGVYLALKDRFDIEEIELTIVQPRLPDKYGQTARSWRIPVVDLLMWAENSLKPAVQKIEDEWTEYSAGKWCKFCPMRGGCKALAEKALDEARVAFDNVPVELIGGGEVPEVTKRTGPPSPELLSGEDLSRILKMKSLITGWLEAIEDEALQRRIAADNGAGAEADPPPGWKVGNKYGHRKWKDPELAEKHLASIEGVQAGDLTETKMRSPAQVEKKLKFAGLTKKGVDQVYDLLVEKPITGQRLIPPPPET